MFYPKKNIAVFVVFLVLLFLQSSGCDKIEEMYDDFKLDEVAEAAKKNPDNAEAHFSLGVAYEEKRDYGSAVKSFSKAIEIDPKAAYYLNRGAAYKAQFNYDHAIEDFKKSLEVDSKFTIAYYHLGQVFLYDKKDKITGCSYYKKYCDAGQCTVYEAQQRNGLCPRTEAELAALNSKDPEIKKLTETIEKNPVDFPAYLGRGMAYESNRDYDRAIKDYTTILEVGLKDIQTHKRWVMQAYRFRANAYDYKEKYDLAIQDLHKILEMDPNQTGVYSSLGGMYLVRFKDREKGCSSYEAMGDSESNFILNNALERGQCFETGSPRYETEYLDKIIANTTQAIARNPKDASAFLNRGRAYADKFQNDLALQDYEKTIELNPDSAEAYIFRGQAYRYKGKQSLPIENFKKALEIDPNNVMAILALANLYLTSGNTKIYSQEKGCSSYKKACSLGTCQGYNIAKKMQGRYQCPNE